MQASLPSNCGRRLSTFAVCAPGLLELGYSPLPRIVRDNHGQPAVKGWSDLCERLPTEHDLRQWSSIAAADITWPAVSAVSSRSMSIPKTGNPQCRDADAPALHSRAARLQGFRASLPPRGWSAAHCQHLSSDEARKSPLLEIMGVGRNITIPPSQHAKTEQPYHWIDPTSGNSRAGDWIFPPLNELPLITNEDLKCLREALAPWSRKSKQPRPTADGPAPTLNSVTEKRYRAYALAGLERARAEMATLKEGRPSELFRSVCALGWSVATGVIGEPEFTAAYLNACRNNGLLAREGQRAIEASIRSGLERAANDPLPHLEYREAHKRPQAPEEQEPDSGPDSCSTSWLRCLTLKRTSNGSQSSRSWITTAYARTRLNVLGSVSPLWMKRSNRSVQVVLVQSESEACLGEALAPWPEPVDGGQLLLTLIAALRAYVILPEHAYLPVALWILHAHAHDAAAISPILAIISPEKRCGKTTLLSLLLELTPKALLAANITAAAVFRAIEVWRPTLLVDEADTFLAEREELRGVINSGHNRRTAVIIRVVEENGEQVPKKFSTWAPKAIAQIKDLPDTLQDRSVAIRLRRKLPGEKVARFRADRTQHLTDINRQARVGRKTTSTPCARWMRRRRPNFTIGQPTTGAPFS